MLQMWAMLLGALSWFSALMCTSAAGTKHQPFDKSNAVTATAKMARFLTGDEDLAGDRVPNIFDQLNGGGSNGDGDNEDNDNNTEDNNQCLRADQFGDYGAETPYTSSILVAWTYQVQGLISMTAQTVRDHVIPLIEAKLAARLVPRLFNNTVCGDDGNNNSQDDKDLLGGDGSGNGQRRRTMRRSKPKRKLRRINPWILDNGAQVTGLFIQPRDSILNGHKGVLCENTKLIPEAKRCFRLMGGLTLTGRNGDINTKQVMDTVQKAIQAIMNVNQALDQAHSLVRSVAYVSAAGETEYGKYFNIRGELPGGGGNDNNNNKSTGDGKSTGEELLDTLDNPRDWPVWVWLVVAALFVMLVMCLFWMRQRNQAQKASFGAQFVRKSKRSRRLLVFASDSDLSEEEEEDPQGSSSEDDDYTPSMTWRQARLMASDLEQRPENPQSHHGGGDGDGFNIDDIGSAKSVHGVGGPNNSYFDARTDQACQQEEQKHQGPRSLASGSFPSVGDGGGSVHSGGMFGVTTVDPNAPDSKSNFSSGYGSSGYGSSANRSQATDEDTDDGSSSHSDDSSPPVPPSGRAWRRSVI